MKRQASIAFDYNAFVDELTARIGAGRLAAARSVNRELISLYWDIGAAFARNRRRWGGAMVSSIGSPAI